MVIIPAFAATAVVLLCLYVLLELRLWLTNYTPCIWRLTQYLSFVTRWLHLRPVSFRSELRYFHEICFRLNTGWVVLHCVCVPYIASLKCSCYNLHAGKNWTSIVALSGYQNIMFSHTCTRHLKKPNQSRPMNMVAFEKKTLMFFIWTSQINSILRWPRFQ